ncbi:hypothetical protein PS850_06209 [Pseudomonas fluorescens]|nr:hypothetical protein PS850_06209 [Pseudomonas fluorescens]
MEAHRTIQITKLQAARSHLKTACALWFADTDPVSTNTLAYAAHEVIHRLYRNAGNTDLLFDTALVKNEFRTDFALLIKESANFFKHANRECLAEDKHEFPEGLNDILLLMSIVGLQRLSLHLELSEAAFLFYKMLRHPTWFPNSQVHKERPEHEIAEMLSLSKPEFFKAYALSTRHLE